jgi:hypothetical protein
MPNIGFDLEIASEHVAAMVPPDGMEMLDPGANMQCAGRGRRAGRALRPAGPRGGARFAGGGCGLSAACARAGLFSSPPACAPRADPPVAPSLVPIPARAPDDGRPSAPCKSHPSPPPKGAPASSAPRARPPRATCWSRQT